MTATLVYEATEQLDPGVKRTLDRALAPIGVEAVGVRGDRTLILSVVNPALAPRNFRDALRKKLESAEAAAVWAEFTGAVYN